MYNFFQDVADVRRPGSPEAVGPQGGRGAAGRCRALRKGDHACVVMRDREGRGGAGAQRKACKRPGGPGVGVAATSPLRPPPCRPGHGGSVDVRGWNWKHAHTHTHTHTERAVGGTTKGRPAGPAGPARCDRHRRDSTREEEADSARCTRHDSRWWPCTEDNILYL